jgi:hypothetical protein
MLFFCKPIQLPSETSPRPRFEYIHLFPLLFCGRYKERKYGWKKTDRQKKTDTDSDNGNPDGGDTT